MSYYQRDKLSIRSNKILANLFAQLIFLTEQVQSFRQILASVPYFDVIELFRLLDKQQKGYLNLNDFINMMGQSHKKVVTYAFSWFDQTKMGQISRLQFISFLLPRNDSQLRQIVARRIQQPIPHHEDPLFYSTINQQLRIFTQMINQMISHQLKIIQQRYQLLKQQNYSLKGVLNSLDFNVHEFVSTKDILKFLKNYAIEATKQQVQGLLEVIDSKLSGKINLQQLRWIVQGLQSKNNQYVKKIKMGLKKKQNTQLRNNIQSKEETQQKSPQKSFVRSPSVPSKSLMNTFSIKQKAQNKKSNKNDSRLNQQSRQPSEAQYKTGKKISSSSNKNSNNIQKSTPNLQPQSCVNKQFSSILQKFKQVQEQSLKKDIELIQIQRQKAKQLRQEYYQKSIQRNKKALSQVNYSDKMDSGQKLYGGYGRVNDFVIDRNSSKEIGKQNQTKRSGYYGHIQSNLRPISTSSYFYQHPINDSLYDKRINTITQNFYRRTADLYPLSSSSAVNNRKFNTTQRDHLIYKPFQHSSYDRNINRKSFLQQQIYRNKNAPLQKKNNQNNVINPFNVEIKKQQLNKKLGEDSRYLSSFGRSYNPKQYENKKRQVEETIRKLKENRQRDSEHGKGRYLNQVKMQIPSNEPLISQQKYATSINANGQTKNTNITSSVNDPYIYKTDMKSQKLTNSSGVRDFNYGASTDKHRGMNTTQTRLGNYQTGEKYGMHSSPQSYQKRRY